MPPPFTNSICPLIQDDAGDAKNNTAWAMSDTSPSLFMGVCMSILSLISGVRTDASAAVLVAPGPMLFILTP